MCSLASIIYIVTCKFLRCGEYQYTTILLKKRHVHESKISLKKLYLIFFLHLKTRINLSGVLFLMEFPPLYLEQMMQWFLEMLRVWQKFQFLKTEKYLPSGWPSLVEVGDRPSWLSWWAKAALCCCKSSSWLCFSSLIFFYNTNVQTNLLRSCL